MALKPQEALNRYEQTILDLTAKLPRFYKYDAQQELRLLVLQVQKALKGNINDEYMFLTMANKLKRFVKLEKNRGITDVSDDTPMDWAELEQLVRETYYEMANNGDKLKVHNHL